MKVNDLFFWKQKSASNNDWRPRPGHSPLEVGANVPPWLRRIDIEAMVVDVAPFICGAGAVAHISQLNNLGWTVPASIWRNPRTMGTMHRAAFFLPILVISCQAAGIEYRNYIPRWSHNRERRRDEVEVRQHIQVGAGVGLGVWAARLFLFRWGRAYRNPILEMTMAGALADLMDREYRKAHGF